MGKKTIIKPKLELAKTNGNVFAILNFAQKTWKKAGNPIEVWFKIKDEALKSGNYDGVIQTLMEYFDVE